MNIIILVLIIILTSCHSNCNDLSYYNSSLILLQCSDGTTGPVGPSGPQGPTGPMGGGVSYVRWGRTDCPGML